MTNWQLVLRQAPAGDFDRAERAQAPSQALESTLRTLWGYAVSGWKWLERKRNQQFSARRMRVTETVALGEKRFVSIVQVDGSQILIGSSAGSVSLLAILDQQQDGWRAGSPAGEQRA